MLGSSDERQTLAVTITIPVVLGARQEKFILALCMGLKPAPAAVAAGYTAANAPRLIRHPAVAGAIRECAANLARTVAVIDAKAPADDLS
jgi:phage terminase small subunit